MSSSSHFQSQIVSFVHSNIMKTTLQHHHQLYDQLSTSCSSIRRELVEFCNAMHVTSSDESRESSRAFWRQVSQYLEALHDYFSCKQFLKLTKITQQEFCDALECVDFIREILNILFSIMDYSQWIKEERFIATITVDGPDKFMQLVQKLRKRALVTSEELQWFEQRWQQKRNSSVNGSSQSYQSQRRNARSGTSSGSGAKRKSSGSSSRQATQPTKSKQQPLIGAPPTEKRKRSASMQQSQQQPPRPNAWNTNSTSTASVVTGMAEIVAEQKNGQREQTERQKGEQKASNSSSPTLSTSQQQKSSTKSSEQKSSKSTTRESSPTMPLSEITQHTSNHANKQSHQSNGSTNNGPKSQQQNGNTSRSYTSGSKKSNKKRKGQQHQYYSSSYSSTNGQHHNQTYSQQQQQYYHAQQQKYPPMSGAPPYYPQNGLTSPMYYTHHQQVCGYNYAQNQQHLYYMQHPLSGGIPSQMLDASHHEISSYAQYNDFTSDYPSDEDSLLNRSGSSDEVEFILTPLSSSERMHPF